MNAGPEKAPSFETRVLMLAVLAGLPGSLLALILLWTGQFESRTQWTLTFLLAVFWLGTAFRLRERVRFPLQTVSNLLAAIQEGDYSIRARGARRNDAMGEVLLELNNLGENLRAQRLGAMEASALLAKVMSEIEVAVFTFDASQRLRLVNRAGERLLANPAERLLGRKAAELHLGECLEGEPARTLTSAFPGGMGRWGMRRSVFREDGAPHQLVVLTDLSRTLREEEREAWQRLLRVLGHELNNSLAPIKSIAGSIEKLLNREPKPEDWEEDTKRGLGVIAARAEALSRFMEAYAKVTRLPRPRLAPVAVRPWVERVAALETRLKVEVKDGPEVTLPADGDQLDQLLINLVRNAADAAQETQGGVALSWAKSGGQLELLVEDEGLGLSNTANLFVPFFTTKPGGSGIGLVLCRQITEAHGGSLTLENRTPERGCRARLRLPMT